METHVGKKKTKRRNLEENGSRKKRKLQPQNRSADDLEDESSGRNQKISSILGTMVELAIADENLDLRTDYDKLESESFEMRKLIRAYQFVMKNPKTKVNYFARKALLPILEPRDTDEILDILNEGNTQYYSKKKNEDFETESNWSPESFDLEKIVEIGHAVFMTIHYLSEMNVLKNKFVKKSLRVEKKMTEEIKTSIYFEMEPDAFKAKKIQIPKSTQAQKKIQSGDGKKNKNKNKDLSLLVLDNPAAEFENLNKLLKTSESVDAINPASTLYKNPVLEDNRLREINNFFEPRNNKDLETAIGKNTQQYVQKEVKNYQPIILEIIDEDCFSLDVTETGGIGKKVIDFDKSASKTVFQEISYSVYPKRESSTASYYLMWDYVSMKDCNFPIKSGQHYTFPVITTKDKCNKFKVKQLGLNYNSDVAGNSEMVKRTIPAQCYLVKTMVDSSEIADSVLCKISVDVPLYPSNALPIKEDGKFYHPCSVNFIEFHTLVKKLCKKKSKANFSIKLLLRFDNEKPPIYSWLKDNKNKEAELFLKEQLECI